MKTAKSHLSILKSSGHSGTFRSTSCLLLGIVLLSATSVPAGQSSPRSVAMGGAYIGLAEGVDAARHNPANLGLSDFQQTGLEIVGAGVNINNNSFSLSDYNKYTGAILTNEDKQYILSRIPDDGLKLSVDAEAAALASSRKNIAFTVTGVGVADVNLNRDIFELIFNGNAFADTIDVTGSYSEALSYVSVGASYGMPVYSAGTRQLAVGATVKYLRGIAIEEVIELEGLAATSATGFEGSGKAVARTATGGSGFGLDLGAALKINDNYTAGVAIKNVISTISWSKDAEEHGYNFEFDTMTIDNFEDDYVVADDYTKELSSFSMSLPAVMTAGVAKRTGTVHWAIDWEQGLRRYAGASTKPRISAGVELAYLNTLPVRFGFATGGGKNTAFSFGSGFHFSAFYLDYALVTGTSFSGYSSKGLNLAIATGLQF